MLRISALFNVCMVSSYFNFYALGLNEKINYYCPRANFFSLNRFLPATVTNATDISWSAIVNTKGRGRWSFNIIESHYCFYLPIRKSKTVHPVMNKPLTIPGSAWIWNFCNEMLQVFPKDINELVSCMTTTRTPNCMYNSSYNIIFKPTEITTTLPRVVAVVTIGGATF